MNANKKTARIYEDVKINVKIKLSALWAVLMFLYIYPDILILMQPGKMNQIMAGELDGAKITQTLLLAGAISMAISSVMVFLCLTLRPKVNRWINIILSIAYMGMVVAFMPGNWAYYIFNSCLEIMVSLLIIWHAWMWPRLESTAPQGISADA